MAETHPGSDGTPGLARLAVRATLASAVGTTVG